MGWWPCGACGTACGPCTDSTATITLAIPSISGADSPCTTTNCNDIFQGTHTLTKDSETGTTCVYEKDVNAACLGVNPLTIRLSFLDVSGFGSILIEFYDGATLIDDTTDAIILPTIGAIPPFDCTAQYTLEIATGESTDLDFTGVGDGRCVWNPGKIFTVN